MKKILTKVISLILSVMIILPATSIMAMAAEPRHVILENTLIDVVENETYNSSEEPMPSTYAFNVITFVLTAMGTSLAAGDALGEYAYYQGYAKDGIFYIMCDSIAYSMGLVIGMPFNIGFSNGWNRAARADKH